MYRLLIPYTLLLLLGQALPAWSDEPAPAASGADSTDLLSDVPAEPAASSRAEGITPERYRAYLAYLAEHADTDGDGDFDSSDIKQMERTGDLEMLRDSDMMGGYFGSGDEFIRDGVEDQVNGGRYLRNRGDDDTKDKKKKSGDGHDMRDMNGGHLADGGVARLDLFGMRQFLTDEDTYASPGEEMAAEQFSHWRSLGLVLSGVLDAPADLETGPGRDATVKEEAPKKLKPRYTKDDPTVWW